MRQHHLAACCQKSMFLYKGPNCPGFCSWKPYPFLANVCEPKTYIRKEYTTKCSNIIWQLAVTKVYSFLKAPVAPGFVFLKRYPFFASVCGPKTNIRNNYSIKCGNIIWQLAVTKVYSFLKAPIARGFVLESLIHFWLTFVSQKHISEKNTPQNAATSSGSLLSQKYTRF